LFMCSFFLFFFFSSRRRHTRSKRDWSSDVCSSDLFKFSNKGDAPIIISEVKPTCGCSIADYTKKPVKPGESGVIKVVFNAEARGPFTKSFIIKSNTKTPVKNLTIKGTVE